MSYQNFKPIALTKYPASNVVRVVHTADNHLRLTHLGSRERGKDFLTATLSVVDVAVQHQAHCIINAGDLMDTPQIQPAVADDLRLLDEKLGQAKMPMYALLGNHDYASPSWLEVQRAMSPNKAQPFGLIPIDDTVFKVYGTELKVMAVPFMAPMELRGRLNKEAEGDVLVWHGSVQEFAGFPVDGMITVEDLTKEHAWKAVLLGDIHITKYFNIDGCLLGYPGATELVKKDEPLTHSCTVIDFDATTKKVLGIMHVPVAHRKVVTLRIDTEQQLEEAVDQLKTLQTAKPIVFAKFSTETNMARSRLLLAAGEGAICRLEGYDPVVMRLVQETAAQGVPKPEHFVDKVIPADQAAAAVARLLVNPDVNPGEVLRSFIAEQMAAA